MLKSIRQHGFNIIFIIGWLLSSLSVWTRDISIEPQYIPTLMNGIVSSISLIVGFNITINILRITRLPERDILEMARVSIHSLIVLSVSFTLIVLSYLQLLSAEYQLALRFALTGLYASFVLAFISTMRITSKAIKEALEKIEKFKKKSGEN